MIAFPCRVRKTAEPVIVDVVVWARGSRAALPFYKVADPAPRYSYACTAVRDDR